MSREFRLEPDAQIGRNRNLEVLKTKHEPVTRHGEPHRLWNTLPAPTSEHPLQPVCTKLPAVGQVERFALEVPIKRLQERH